MVPVRDLLGISEKDNTHQDTQKEAIVPAPLLFQQGTATGRGRTNDSERCLEAFALQQATSFCHLPLQQIKPLTL